MAGEDLLKIRNHKENLQKVLYETDFSSDSSDWRTFPKCKIKVDYITYDWERLDKDNKYQKYNWDKIVLSIFKLKLNNWVVEIDKKILTNRKWEQYVADDKKEIIFSVDEFENLLSNIDLNDIKK